MSDVNSYSLPEDLKIFTEKDFVPIRDSDLIGRGGEACIYKRKTNDNRFLCVRERTINYEKYQKEIEILKMVRNSKFIVHLEGIWCNTDDTNRIPNGIVLEYMEGGNLASVLHSKLEYTYDHVYNWLFQAASGLEELHEKNIYHRDIKPTNMLVNADWSVLKLADFGIAKRIFANTVQTGFGKTVMYSSPELLYHSEGDEYSYKSDIYSLAVSLWEMFHRRLPYTDDADALSKMKNDDRPTIDRVTDKETKDLIIKSWDRNIETRYSAKEIVEFCKKKMLTSMPEMITLKPVNCILVFGNETTLIHHKSGVTRKLFLEVPYPKSKIRDAFYLNGEIFTAYDSEDWVSTEIYNLTQKMQWVKLSRMNRERQYTMIVLLDGCLWVIGGTIKEDMHIARDLKEFQAVKTVEKYNPVIGRWTFQKEMNIARKDAGAAVVNGKIYICGGITEYEIHSSVEFFDPYSNTWTLIESLPHPRQNLTALTLGSKLIIMGRHIEIEASQNDVWQLDLYHMENGWQRLTNIEHDHGQSTFITIGRDIFVAGSGHKTAIFNGTTWSRGPEILSNGAFASVVIPQEVATILDSEQKRHSALDSETNAKKKDEKESIVIFGGYNRSFSKEIYVLDDDSDTWQHVQPSLPILVSEHATVYIKPDDESNSYGDLFLIGGMGGNNKILNMCLKLHPTKGWMQMASMKFPRSNISNSCVYFEGCIWVVGGLIPHKESAVETDKVEKYNPKLDKWTRAPSLNQPRQGVGLVVCNGRLFAVGGAIYQQAIVEIEYFDSVRGYWEFLDNKLPYPLVDLSVIGLNNGFYVLGGSEYTEGRRDNNNKQFIYNTVYQFIIEEERDEEEVEEEDEDDDEGIVSDEATEEFFQMFIENDYQEAPRIPKEITSECYMLDDMNSSRCRFSAVKKIDNQFFLAGGIYKYEEYKEYSRTTEYLNGEERKAGPDLPTELSDTSMLALPYNFKNTFFNRCHCHD